MRRQGCVLSLSDAVKLSRCWCRDPLQRGALRAQVPLAVLKAEDWYYEGRRSLPGRRLYISS